MKITRRRQWVLDHPIIFSLGLIWLGFIAAGAMMTVWYGIATIGALL